MHTYPGRTLKREAMEVPFASRWSAHVLRASSSGRYAAMAGSASSSSSWTGKNNGSKPCGVADRRRDARPRIAGVNGGSASGSVVGVSGSQHTFYVSRVRSAACLAHADGRTKSSTKRSLRLWLMVPILFRLLPGV
jgi:hypothetical protein